MTSANITLPKKTLSAIYKKMVAMQKNHEELDHLIAQMDVIQGNIHTVKNIKSLKNELGYPIH